MASPLESLEPQSLWMHFDGIRKIPRPSGKEGKIREHMIAFARENNCEVRKDDAGNICIAVPATPGHEKAPPVVLQGHMDMVCEKNSDTEFDFDNDPLDVIVEGDWVSANGTTLGADNGLGLAAGMAAVTDESVVHGPLELLCTVDEETGLTGAMNLDASMVKGRVMLNLDSEDDGVLFVGCAGGTDVSLLQPIEMTDAPKLPAAEIVVRGFRGGHSGLDIGENRGNAIRVLTRTLDLLRKGPGLWLAHFDGGSAHNAIPREARAVVMYQAGGLDALKATVQEAFESAQAEYGAIEKAMAMEVEEADSPIAIMSKDSASKLVDLLLALPHGAHAMSRDIEGLVETSNNLATVRMTDGGADVLLSVRSSVAASIRSTLDQIISIGTLSGAKINEHAGYPGWEPNMDSKVLELGRQVFTEIWGKEPLVTAIHAGLECGLIGEQCEGMDMLSFGPALESVHSPDERAQISSTARFWDALKSMLRKLA